MFTPGGSLTENVLHYITNISSSIYQGQLFQDSRAVTLIEVTRKNGTLVSKTQAKHQNNLGHRQR